MNHLVERRRDKSRQSYYGGILLQCRIDDGIGIHHHAKVLHAVAVALRHHRHDVLADVVHVALHGSHDDEGVVRVFRSIRNTLLILITLGGFHIRLQHRHGFLHHPGRLHHLGQEHLAVAEELPHPVHGRHQVVVYHAQRRAFLLIGLFGVLVYVVGHALQHGIFYAFVQGFRAPVGSLFLGCGSPTLRLLRILLSLHALSIFYEALRRSEVVRISVVLRVQHHRLHHFQHILGNVLIAHVHGGVHNAHVKTLAHSVVQEYGVHGLAYLVVSAKGKRQVADAARHVYLWHLLVYRFASSYKGTAVVVVLRHARGHRQHVGVKDDVLRRETDAFEQRVCAACHGHFAFVGVCLTVLVKQHHHRGGTHGVYVACLGEELLLAFLQ